MLSPLEFRPDIAIDRIDPRTMTAGQQLRFAEQAGHLMVGVQRFYMRELGLRRIDTDPPPGSREDNERRLKTVQHSGRVQIDGTQFIASRYLEGDGTPSERLDGLAGMIVLTKPNYLCVTGQHRATEILEFDVTEHERDQGIGSALLRAAVTEIHVEDKVVLDVAEPNTDAIGYYERHGFDMTGVEFSHGVFDVTHLGMSVPARDLYENLGVTPL